MTMAQAVAQRLNDYLFERRTTLYALAQKAELPPATLQNLYRGKIKSPTLTVVYKICTALNVSVGEFLDCEYFNAQELELE